MARHRPLHGVVALRFPALTRTHRRCRVALQEISTVSVSGQQRAADAQLGSHGGLLADVQHTLCGRLSEDRRVRPGSVDESSLTSATASSTDTASRALTAACSS
jgi:hypothetical protein